MTITIGSFSCSQLAAQPFGYEGDPRQGLTARTFRVSGLLTAAQWQSLISVYNTWRDARIQDEDTIASESVGTTVSLTITSTNGLTVTNLPCWFAEPPSGDQAGPYINASAVLVDAAQALAVLLRAEEKNKQREDAEVTLDIGTLTFGITTIKLTAPAKTRRDGPQVALTATGASYVTGPLVAHNVRQVQGYIIDGTYNGLLDWYDTTISSVPSKGTWFPVEPPSATAEPIVEDGVKSTRYNVQMTVLEIL